MQFLVVDDDPHILEALAVSLQLQWPDSAILSAQDGVAGLALFYRHRPDLIVLDLSMPQKNGFEVLQEVRRTSDLPVIVLTARGDDLSQVRGLELGADDYLMKPFSPLVLIARIKAILRRVEQPAAAPAGQMIAAGNLAINLHNHEVLLHGEPVRLTPVEFKLLAYLARNAGRLLPHQAILDAVWGADYIATTDYLKVFISRLRAKLERPGEPRYIETERGLGYRFVRPAETPAPRS
ncbi:MAG: response regulator transcription factor [Thermomicrobiales bacterium]